MAMPDVNGQGNDMVTEGQFVKLFNQVFNDWGDIHFFQWKYTNNPFGDNIVQYSVEDDQVVSSRIFMRWTMHDGEQAFRCYQATDAATLASHRGKGLFKTLTLACLDQMEEGDFVFNFPNQNSFATNIKLGWKSVENIRPLIVPTVNLFTGKPKEAASGVQLIGTQWSDELLQWRLANGKAYHAFNVDGQRRITYRLQSVKGLNVADVIQTHPELTLAELKRFCRTLRRQGIFAIRYIGLNTAMRSLIENHALIKFHYGSGVNFVTNRAPEAAQFRIEMIDADYI
ncbi:GNAT family N-acetyltransferase [Ferrimonas balearica]|uniref:GNAT family N-acetyltransferase n=1 Tax=Ferrimonas balearica TaxID=44012 RepID=UPI001C95B158|nr:GNAT family N-acetyltransferase [Ferrimonas balearica]MBY5978954.1 GNAT family N-acetyltransferase [Ferrimonas balearica]